MYFGPDDRPTKLREVRMMPSGCPSCRHACGGAKEVRHVRVDSDEGDLEPHGCRVFQGLDCEGIVYMQDERVRYLLRCRPAWDVLEGFIYANSVTPLSSLISSCWFPSGRFQS